MSDNKLRLLERERTNHEAHENHEETLGEISDPAVGALADSPIRKNRPRRIAQKTDITMKH
jgi:hypothetical protein